MHALTNTAFLQALGYAIANSLWQMALLWILLVLVFGIVKMNAANKYRLAVFAQTLGCLWFAFTLQFYYLQCNDALKQSNEFISHQHFNVMLPYAGSNLQSSCLNFMLNAERLLPYLSAAYLLLLSF
ncbi:MAG: hypothetical protein H7178_04865 [Chitinophagaceae bacterium]|nr:hypothetical protein [Chitinophagaceae bacterium]